MENKEEVLTILNKRIRSLKKKIEKAKTLQDLVRTEDKVWCAGLYTTNKIVLEIECGAIKNH